jgi:ABC-2 type transport system ATP-binding protein
MRDDLAIEATGLEKSYGDVRVLDGVDLEVPPGSVFALLGPNGAGKTTTVRILSTLIAPDRGTARVAGHDVVAGRRGVRRAISLTGQYAAVDELQTGEENLRMMGRLAGLRRADARVRARDLLARFDLVDAGDRRVGTWSGGMRRRLDLAASLVARPAVLFLDEPTTGLDPRSRSAMWGVIRELVDGGATVLLTTQYLEEADGLAGRIAVIDGGRIVAEGTAAQLKRMIAGPRPTRPDAGGSRGVRGRRRPARRPRDGPRRRRARPGRAHRRQRRGRARAARRGRSPRRRGRLLRDPRRDARRRLPRTHRPFDAAGGLPCLTR